MEETTCLMTNKVGPHAFFKEKEKRERDREREAEAHALLTGPQPR